MTPDRDDDSEPSITAPSITHLGNWPAVEEEIRQRARDQGAKSEDIDAFVAEIKKRRSDQPFRK